MVHCGVGVGGGLCVTVTVVVGGSHCPGLDDGFVVCAVTASVSDPDAGLKVPELNPADVHAVRAFATVRPTRFGTLTLGGTQPFTVNVTTTTAVRTRQSPGDETGDVVWVRTVSVSDPVAGVNAPVNPAVVQAERAPCTDCPTMFGTTA